MAKSNKPVPKKTWQAINETIKPYPKLDRGNPNPDKPRNRANDISVKDDTDKQFDVGLGDFYKAIEHYLRNVIKPFVIENNEMVNVPIEYAHSERWNAAQKEGFLRDKDGRMLLPVIAIKRDSIVRNRNLGNKLDANRVHNYQSFYTQYNRKNQYDNFSVLMNRIPVKRYHLEPVPDYVTVTFNCSIFTNFQSQMDDVIQAINYSADSYWGQQERFKFKVNIESFSNAVEYTQGTDRSVRCDFNIVLNGYLLADSVQRNNAAKKGLTKAQIVFKFETISGDVTTAENIFVGSVPAPNQVAATTIDSYNHNTVTINQFSGSVSGSVDPALLNYINLNLEYISPLPLITPNTATFLAGIQVAPPSLPPTSVLNFIFFANGQYISTGSILSFVENIDGTSTLTVDTGSLGWSFGDDWEIVGRGKFRVTNAPPPLTSFFLSSIGNYLIDSDGAHLDIPDDVLFIMGSDFWVDSDGSGIITD